MVLLTSNKTRLLLDTKLDRMTLTEIYTSAMLPCTTGRRLFTGEQVALSLFVCYMPIYYMHPRYGFIIQWLKYVNNLPAQLKPCQVMAIKAQTSCQMWGCRSYSINKGG